MCREYADAYSVTYEEPVGFLEFLRERNRRTQWRKTAAPDLKYAVLEDGAEIDGPHGSYTEEEWQDIAEDTRQNTRLVLQTEYGSIPVRDCAIRSVLQRAGIAGRALPKLEKSVYAQVLNYCMEVSQGMALLCISDGKISAVHGGDNRGYTVLEIPELFRAVTEYLEGRFSSGKFLGGYYDHSIVTATWELGEESELIRDYQDLLDRYGLESRPMTPALRFTCSDIGSSGANLFPMGVAERNADDHSGQYIREAEDAALDRALYNAGFGVQYTVETPETEKAPKRAAAKKTGKAEQPAVNADGQTALTGTSSPTAEEATAETPKEAAPASPAPSEEAVASVAEAEPAAGTVTPIEKAADNSALESLLSSMTLREAVAVIVDVGAAKGKTIGMIAKEDPKQLLWFRDSYKGPNDHIRAAATLLLREASDTSSSASTTLAA